MAAQSSRVLTRGRVRDGQQSTAFDALGEERANGFTVLAQERGGLAAGLDRSPLQ